MLHTIRAKTPLEQIDNAAMLKLAGLHFEQIVREGEEPEAGAAQLSEGARHLRIWRHRRKFFLELLLVRIADLDALRCRDISITAAPISVKGT
jgi:hypothetical protein